MIVERITTPANPPFALGEVQLHLRADSADFTDEVTRIARAAAAEVERFCQVALLTQTVRLTLISWPGGTELALPISPVLADAEVTVTVDGEELAGAELLTGERPRLVLTEDQAASLVQRARVVITYEAGHGETDDIIPPDLAHAVMDQAAALFDQRGGDDDKSRGTMSVSPAMQRIAARYRRVAL